MPKWRTKGGRAGTCHIPRWHGAGLKTQTARLDGKSKALRHLDRILRQGHGTI